MVMAEMDTAPMEDKEVMVVMAEMATGSMEDAKGAMTIKAMGDL